MRVHAEPAAAPARFLYAASEACADLLYATGLITPDPFLWFAADGVRAVVIGPLELGRARQQVKPGVLVLSEAEARQRYGLEASAKLTPENLLPAISRQTAQPAWQVSPDLALGLARALEKAGLVLTTVKEFFPERALKTAAELELIRAGVAAAEQGLARAVAVLREAEADRDGWLHWRGQPLSAEQLRGEIAAAVALAGGMAAHTIAAPGVQGANPHVAGNGPVRAGEPIVIDIFPRMDATGYFGDLTRTVVKGHAPDGVRAAFSAVAAAQAAAIRTVRAGVPAKQVHAAAASVLSAAGFHTETQGSAPHGFFHGLGHGVGLEIHEMPRVNGSAETLLQTGHVITIEPGLYYPEWGGVRIEDVVAVTADGCENLTTAPVVLEIE